MCGILVLISTRDSFDSKLGHISNMASLMEHRGPDDSGFAFFSTTGSEKLIAGDEHTAESSWGTAHNYLPNCKIDEIDLRPYRIVLAHRRLSILDLNASGHQPLCDHAGRYWIVFNGEIYNYNELRIELQSLGYNFTGTSDTEVALHAYMEWGNACQERFNGMWAIVIWDHKLKRLWISRDRFGVKPLYYRQIGDLLVFTSEIKATVPIAPLRLNSEEAYCYLLDGASESHPETLYQDVFRFPAGASAEVDACRPAHALTTTNYYQYGHGLRFDTYSERRCRDYAEGFYDLLHDAVRIRLHADVPVSCALSGGLDSSAITYLAHDCRRDQNEGKELHTVSNTYSRPETVFLDESRFIHQTAHKLGIANHSREVNLHCLPKLVARGFWAFENCPAGLPLAGMNTFSLCKEHGFKVNLDGQGADELLAGYSRYWNNYLLQAPLLRCDTIANILLGPLSASTKIRTLAERIGFSRGNLESCPELSSAISRRPDDGYRLHRTFSRRATLTEALEGSYHAGVKLLLRDVDAWSMINSVESRQPFMDYRLYEFLQSVPLNYRMHGGWSKYLMRRAFSGRLDSSIVWRRDKMGWPQPSRFWMNTLLGTESIDALCKNDLLRTLLPNLDRTFLAKLYEQVDKNHAFMRLFILACVGHLFLEQTDVSIGRASLPFSTARFQD